MDKQLSNTLLQIKSLVKSGNILISEHGYDELANDELSVKEIVVGVKDAILVEDYPDFFKGATVLVLQTDKNSQPVHVVWGIPKGCDTPAVLITAYRPDPNRWHNTFMERR